MTNTVLAHPPPRFEDNSYVGRWAAALQADGTVVHGLSIMSVLGNRGATVHIHWPEHLLLDDRRFRRYLKSVRSIVILLLLKMFAMPVFLTAHNLEPHEVPLVGLQKHVLNSCHRLATGVIVTTIAHIQMLQSRYPLLAQTAFYQIPLGSLVNEESDPDQDTSVAEVLTTPRDEPVRFIQFGAISPYKEQLETIEYLAPLLASGRATLIVVGRVLDEEYADRLHACASRLRGVEIVPSYVSDAELGRLVRNADVSLALQRNVLNSGVIPASVPAGTRVLAENSAQARARQEDLGSDWIQLVDMRSELVQPSELLTWAVQPARRPPVEFFDWSANIKRHLEAYDDSSDSWSRLD